MKIKAVFTGLALALCTFGASAENPGIFNHLSVGVNAGTTGVGVDIAMPVTRFLTIRPGYTWMPKIKPTVNFDVDVPDRLAGENIPSFPREVDMQGELKFNGPRVLVDFYPIPSSGFHLTAGAFFGNDEVVALYNKAPGVLKGVADYNYGTRPAGYEPIGVELGDYLLTPDREGNINASLKVKKVRPYLGIGFGRAIPGAPVGFMLELGAQFWGKPAVFCNGDELTEDKVGGGDAGKIIKTISKISVFPVLNFRLCGKIF